MSLKNVLYGAVALFFIYSIFFQGDSSDSGGEVEYEEVVLPTQGLITIVKEVEKDQFKIDDEITVPETDQSLIVANYLDSTADTFTLEEAKLMESNGYEGREGSVMRAASYGLFAYMMFGRMSSARRPQAGAYTSKEAYNRTSQKAGSTLNKTASRTTRVKPGSGKSGFGGSKSSRSFGG